SGINNTFRQLGIAAGIAGLGAIFTHHASDHLDPRVAIVDGLDAVLAVAAAIALVAAVICWPLLGRQRSTPPGLDP
ncbi:MAG TPA: hypothetical protein VFQ14_02840, partial [Thermoleophilaceae bacterium]|nr:hypothetical protein [Thermoleophilaceae bacterium]